VSSIEIEGQKFNSLEVKKMSSNAETMSIHLTRNFKIVDRLKEYSKNKDIKVIAFKLTSDASIEQRLTAVDKLFKNSNAALVVHNDLTEIDIFKKTHKFTIHLKNLEQPEGNNFQKKLICENVEQLTNNLIQFLISNNIQENSL
jgi:phosphopantothenoylcysteine decarboxylase/phosphopantothenate--cysteine ligase